MKQTSENLRQLERTMFRAWPAFETIDYDGWVLRFADGYTKRANSVNPHFGSQLPLMTRIAHCEDLSKARGLPTIFRLTPFSQPAELDDTLQELGYETLDPSLVMTASFDRAPDHETDAVLRVTADEWLSVFETLRGLPAPEREPHRRIIESSEGERCFARLMKNGESRACGLGIHVDAAVGLFDLYTADGHRNQGLASAVVGSILHWAYQRGARSGFLQVHGLNVPARRLYERFGFADAYPYWYRIKM